MWRQCLLVMIVVMALIPSSSFDGKILIDLSHNERILRTPSNHNVPCFSIFEDTYEITESYVDITYGGIQDYDVLLIGMPQEIFSSFEIETLLGSSTMEVGSCCWENPRQTTGSQNRNSSTLSQRCLG
jgi:hypothetical protein